MSKKLLLITLFLCFTLSYAVNAETTSEKTDSAPAFSENAPRGGQREPGAPSENPQDAPPPSSPDGAAGENFTPRNGGNFSPENGNENLLQDGGQYNSSAESGANNSLSPAGGQTDNNSPAESGANDSSKNEANDSPSKDNGGSGGNPSESGEGENFSPGETFEGGSMPDMGMRGQQGRPDNMNAGRLEGENETETTTDDEETINGVSDFCYTYSTPIISVALLAAAFVFVIFYKRIHF